MEVKILPNKLEEKYSRIDPGTAESSFSQWC